MKPSSVPIHSSKTGTFVGDTVSTRTSGGGGGLAFFFSQPQKMKKQRHTGTSVHRWKCRIRLTLTDSAARKQSTWQSNIFAWHRFNRSPGMDLEGSAFI